MAKKAKLTAAKVLARASRKDLKAIEINEVLSLCSTLVTEMNPSELPSTELMMVDMRWPAVQATELSEWLARNPLQCFATLLQNRLNQRVGSAAIKALVFSFKYRNLRKCLATSKPNKSKLAADERLRAKGMTVEEIAQKTGNTFYAVKQRRYRAKKAALKRANQE